MDGSTLSLIVIPIVVMISLATWLVLVAYAASHPEWKRGPAAPQGARTTPAPRAQIPRPRTETPRSMRQPAGIKPLAAGGHGGH